MKRSSHGVFDSQFVNGNFFGEISTRTTSDRQYQFEFAEITAYPAKISRLASLIEKLNKYKTVNSINLTRTEFQELLRLQSVWKKKTS